MNQNEKAAFEYEQKYHQKNDFQYFINHYDRLLNISNNICQYLEICEDNVDKTETIAGLLFIKYYKQAKSLFILFKASQHSNNYYDYDLSTIYILLRSLLENYLTFYYLYIDSKNEEEALFRYNIYKMCSYIARQKFEIKDEVLNRIKENEKNQLIKLQIAIKQDPIYQALDTDLKKMIIQGRKPRIIGWTKLIDSVNFNDIIKIPINNSWSHFSNHAHSDFASIEQTKYYLNNVNELYDTKYSLISGQIFLTSKYIEELSNIFKGINEMLKNESDDISIINTFSTIYSKEKT